MTHFQPIKYNQHRCLSHLELDKVLKEKTKNTPTRQIIEKQS